MSKHSQTPATLIKDRGGPHAVARALGIKPGAVRMWAQRNVLPRAAWPELLDAFPDLSIEALREIEAATRRAEAPAQDAA